MTARVENFAWRVEQLVQEDSFALILGERLSTLCDVVVGVLERPQSKSADFYRELVGIFSVKLSPSNR